MASAPTSVRRKTEIVLERYDVSTKAAQAGAATGAGAGAGAGAGSSGRKGVLFDDLVAASRRFPGLLFPAAMLQQHDDRDDNDVAANFGSK